MGAIEAGEEDPMATFDRRPVFALLLSAGLLGLLAPSLRAQSFTGSVTGTVKDESGGVLAHIEVRLVNESTNEKRNQLTADSGNFTFPLVPPGRYRLEVETGGFRKYVRSLITVEVQQQVVINPILQVGGMAEALEVKGETPLLQPTTSSLGQVVDNRKIVELPLSGRNTLALIGLTSGAQPVGQFGGIPARTNAYNQGFFSTSGSQVLTNETLIDGLPANAALFNAPAYVPVVDSVQEFKVQTSTLPAEFGRTGGGVVNIVTKSGGNELHGTGYEFFRNKDLSANNWFNNRAGIPRPLSTLHQFGATLGGRIKLPSLYDGRDKTFWFVSYEGLREDRGLTQTFTIPTPEQLQGDFSKTRNNAGQLIVIYDPLTTRPDPNNPGRFIRDPFPGNRIPANRIDPVAASIRSFWPAPNTAGTAAGANNFIGNGAARNVQNQFSVRLDHSFSLGHKLSARFALSNVQRGAVDFFDNGGGWVNPGGGGVPLVFNARNVSLDYTWTVKPTLLFNARYGFVRQFVGKEPALTGLDLASIGFPASFNQQAFWRALPAFQPSGFRAIAPASSDLIDRTDNTHAFQASLTKVFSRHTVKLGADVRYIPIGELQPNAPQGVFNFDSRFTGADPLSASAASGHSIASFLLGLPSSGSIDFNPLVDISSNYFGGYVQDDFKVSSRLTLNLGLRYEVETGRSEREDRLSWFDPSAASPIASRVGLPALRGGLKFAGVDGNPRRQKDTDFNNFGPRVGFAYTLDPKTVMRGGYGVFYLPMTGDDTGRNLGGEGFFAATSYVSSLDGGITPAGRLSNPFPNGLNQPPGSSQGLLTLLGQDIITVLRNDRTAYAQEWNLNLQRELPGGFLFDIAYAGMKGSKLPIDLQLNQLPDQHLTLGPQLLQRVPNPFFGLVTVGPLSQATVTRGQLLRPFPQFGNVNVRAVHQGSSIYHALQVKVERRFSHGFSLLGAYTFSKLLTDAGSRLAINFASPGIQNSNNLSAERSLGNVDIPHRAVLSYNWELPFGSGRALLSGAHGALGWLVSGWQVNGITTIQSGPPLGLTTAVNQTNSFGGGSRPNSSGQSARLEGPVVERLGRYFDTSVFSQPPAFTFGNTARTLPDVRAPGSVNFDFSVFKNISLGGRAKAQLRVEAFNLFNHPNFGGPGTTFGTSTFGVISSAADARVVQLGLKLLF
jgi:Carboxypeptidase regulatory-like domain/TonB dependent receptor